MDYGQVAMPSHPPARRRSDGRQRGLQVLRWADALGFREAWLEDERG